MTGGYRNMDEYTKRFVYHDVFFADFAKSGITIRETVYKKSGQITVME